MAFKTVEMYNQDKYKGKFRLANNGDSADVIFLYRGMSDMLVADTHYLQSANYNGYVHCNGVGCALCAMRKNDGSPKYRKDSKLFIPLYNITTGGIEFWDRSINFEPQMTRDVFASYPNPSEIVFKVTRRGESRDVNTTYDIRAISRNSYKSYDDILKEANAQFPAYYGNIVREFSNFELESMTSHPSSNSGLAQDYVPIPRGGFQSSMPTTYVDISSAIGTSTTTAPTELPSMQPTATTDDDLVPMASEESLDVDVPWGNSDSDEDLADPMF